MDSILMMNARKFLVFFFMALITIFIMFSSSSSAASRFISSAVLFFLISAVIPLHLSRFSLPISQGFSRFSVKNHPTASSCCVEYQNTSKTKFQELLLYLDQRIENWRRFPVIERLKRQSRISGRLSYKEPNITLFDIYDLGLKPSLHSARIHIENWRRFPGIERLNTQSRISISGRLSYKESNIPLFDIYDLGLKPSLHSARIHIENWRRFPGIERLNTQSRLSGRLSYKEPSITLFDIYDLGLKLSLHSARIHEAVTFMISSQNSYSLRRPHFQVSKQPKTYSFNRIIPSIHVIAHKQVVCVWALSSHAKKLSKIMKFSMNITTKFLGLFTG